MQPVPLLAASARVKRRRLLAPRDSAETAPGAGFARGDESPDEDEDDAPRARSVRAIGAPEVAERPQSSFGGHLRGRSVGDEGGGNDGAANGGAEDGDRGAIAVSRGGGGGSQIARLVARRKQASVLAAADGDGDDAAAFRADLAACADAGDETYAQVPVDQFAKRMLTAMGWRAESAGSAKRAPVKQPRPRPPRLGLGAKPETQKEVAQKEAERKETVQQGTTPQARGVNGAAMAGVEVAEERHAGKRAAEYCREDDAVEPRNYDRRDDRDDGWRANERRQRREAGDFERRYKRRDGRRDEGQWDEVAAESRNRDERDVRYDARRADERRRLREADDREQDYRGRGRQGDRTIRDRSRERYMRDDLGGYGDRDRDRQRDGDRYRDRDRHRDRDRERDRDRNRDRDRHRDRDRRYSFRSRSRSPRLR